MTKQYLDAVHRVMNEGTRKPSRTGIDTISKFNVNMEFDLRNGQFPLLTTKRINWFNIVAENLWFLSGATDIGFLKKHGIKFWDAWADEDGNVPSAYGNFWRHFPVPSRQRFDWNDGDISELEMLPNTQRIENGEAVTVPVEGYNDQIAWVVDQLKTNPMSRRLVVSAWAPGNAQTSKLPPCHAMFVLNVQNLPPGDRLARMHEFDMNRGCERCGQKFPGPLPPGGADVFCPAVPAEPHLCLHLTQRSCDMGLGVPYTIAGYAFILSLLAHLTGLKAGIFSHSLVDAHIYTKKPDGTFGGAKKPTGELYEDPDYDHIPKLREQLTRAPRPLPKLTINPELKSLEDVAMLTDLTDGALVSDSEDVLLDTFRLTGYDPHPPLRMKAAV